VLIASGLTAGAVKPMEIVLHLYYPLLIGLSAILAIAFQYPKKYTLMK
jgi:hypothetical protein